MKLQCLLFCAFAFVNTPICNAQNTTPVCPATLAEGKPIAPPNTSWEGLIYAGRGEPHVESVMVFDGHPREMASLAPEQSMSSLNEVAAVWRFQQSDPQRGVWIACTYTNTNAILAMRLPSKIRECRLTQSATRLGKNTEVKALQCE